MDASGVEDEAYLCCWVENDSASTCPALCYGGLALHARKRLRVTCPAMKTYDRTVYLAVFLLVLEVSFWRRVWASTRGGILRTAVLRLSDVLQLHILPHFKATVHGTKVLARQANDVQQHPSVCHCCLQE